MMMMTNVWQPLFGRASFYDLDHPHIPVINMIIILIKTSSCNFCHQHLLHACVFTKLGLFQKNDKSDWIWKHLCRIISLTYLLPKSKVYPYLSKFPIFSLFLCILSFSLPHFPLSFSSPSLYSLFIHVYLWNYINMHKVTYSHLYIYMHACMLFLIVNKMSEIKSSNWLPSSTHSSTLPFLLFF